MGAKKKYYVVWVGAKTGVFDNWNDCKAQVMHFEGAKYKSFETLNEAQSAFLEGYPNYYRNHPSSSSGICSTTEPIKGRK